MATATVIPQAEQPTQNAGPLLANQNVVPLPIAANTVPAGVAVPVVTAGAAGVMPMPMHPPSASLYVGDLLSDVTEAMLFEVFSQVGAVASIRVCRDAVTRRSLGYAYVNFHNVVDAERGLDTLNYAPIKGRPCRIMWSQRDPALRKSGVGNIFIKNLDITIDNKALHDTFSAFGNILSCKVVNDESGSKGYGFVHYDTMEAAHQAINKVNGMLLCGKKVFVGLHVPRRARESKVDEMKARFTNVFVKELDEATTDEELRGLFGRYGNITSLMISRDENGKSRGFGFINFESHDQAVAAVDAMNNYELNGKRMFAGRAQKRGERDEELRRLFEQVKLEKMSKYQGVNLYIKNLDDTVDDERLRQEFAVFGTITSAKVMRDEKGTSKGFGFVCFSAAEEATKAVTEMNSHMIGAKPIYVALAQKREVRRAQLELQHAQRGQMRLPATGVAPGPMFGGAPMYYGASGIPPHQRQNFMFPQPMMPRPRWGGQVPPAVPGAPMGPQQVRPPYQSIPNYPPGSVPRQGMPTGPRQNRRPPMPNGANIPSQRPLSNGIPSGIPQNGAPGMNQPRRGNYNKYGPGVRNVRDGNMMGGAPVMMPNAMIPQAIMGEPVTAAYLAGLPAEQQKQVLGERLFPLISEREPQLAGKITGMLLEMENEELLLFLENPEALYAKVAEAVQVWQAHQAAAPKSEGDAGLNGAIAVAEE